MRVANSGESAFGKMIRVGAGKTLLRHQRVLSKSTDVLRFQYGTFSADLPSR